MEIQLCHIQGGLLSSEATSLNVGEHTCQVELGGLQDATETSPSPHVRNMSALVLLTSALPFNGAGLQTPEPLDHGHHECSR